MSVSIILPSECSYHRLVQKRVRNLVIFCIFQESSYAARKEEAPPSKHGGSESSLAAIELPHQNCRLRLRSEIHSPSQAAFQYPAKIDG